MEEISIWQLNQHFLVWATARLSLPLAPEADLCLPAQTKVAQIYYNVPAEPNSSEKVFCRDR